MPYLPLPPARAAARAPVLTANWGRCRFNKDVEVKAHHGNIKDKQFGVPYMKQFDLVFNALDNVGELRRRAACTCRPVTVLHAGVQMRGATSTGYASPRSARWWTAAPRATSGR